MNAVASMKRIGSTRHLFEMQSRLIGEEGEGDYAYVYVYTVHIYYNMYIHKYIYIYVYKYMLTLFCHAYYHLSSSRLLT